MFTRKTIQRLVLSSLLFSFGVAFSACDQNILPPPDPSASEMVSIDSFTVDNETITAGEIVKLSWSVTGAYSKILILPDIGEVPAADSLLIKPENTITYTLQVFAIPSADGEDELGRIDQIKVTVNPAEEPAEPAGDENVVPVSETTPDPVADGGTTDPIPDDGTDETDPQPDPDPEIEGDDAADDAPVETAHIVSFSADKTQVLWGEPITLSWEVELSPTAPLLTLNDESVSPFGQVSLTAGIDGSSWQLLLTTAEGSTVDSQTKNLNVSEFSAPEKFGDFGSLKVSAFVTSGKQECWFASDKGEIYHSEDALETIVRETNSGLSGDIRSLALDGNSLLYVGTTQGLYYRRLSDDAFTQIGDTGGLNAITAILPRAGEKNLLIGSEKALYESYAVANTKDCPYDNTAGYCIVAKDFLTESPNVYRILSDPNQAKRVVLLTDAGAYLSEDTGETFQKLTNLPSGLTEGSWDDNGGYLWGSRAAVEWNSEDETFSNVDDLPDLTGAISSVLRLGDYLFVADGSGVQASRGAGWFATDLTSSVTHFWGSQKSGISASQTLHAFTKDGRLTDLSWSNRFFIFRDIGAFLPLKVEAVWQIQ